MLSRLLSFSLFFLTTSSSAFSEPRDKEYRYKQFNNLTDPQAAEARVDADNERWMRVKRPNNDFLPLTGNTALAFEECRSQSTMMIFNADTEAFVSACEKALKEGAADAGFILGTAYYNGEWIAADYLKAQMYFEKAAELGSREARRSLIFYYTHPYSGVRDSHKAFALSASLSDSGNQWDEMVYSVMQVSQGSLEEARQGQSRLISLASEGYQNAAAFAAYSKINPGPLQDLKYSRELFSNAQSAWHTDLTYAKAMLAIADNDFQEAFSVLESCYQISVRCAYTYVSFNYHGIGTRKDDADLVGALEYLLKQFPNTFANEYLWLRSVSPEGDLFDPVAAMKALKAIPDYKKQQPEIMDTIAANYAANDDFTNAVITQQKAIALSEGRGRDAMVQGMRERLSMYEQEKRWIKDTNPKSYIMRLRNMNNFLNMDAELAAM